MKLKKLLNVMVMSQPLKFVSTNGRVTKRTPVVRFDEKFNSPFIETLEKFKVHSIRHVHIEITLIGGNDND